MREAGCFVGNIVTIILLCKLVMFCRAGCVSARLWDWCMDGGRKRPALRQEDIQCEVAGDRRLMQIVLRGAMWASRPTRCGRIRRGLAIHSVQSAGTSRTPSPAKHHPKQSVGRGPVPRRCPGAKTGGPRVAVLQWVRPNSSGRKTGRGIEVHPVKRTMK